MKYSSGSCCCSADEKADDAPPHSFGPSNTTDCFASSFFFCRLDDKVDGVVEDESCVRMSPR